MTALSPSTAPHSATRTTDAPLDAVCTEKLTKLYGTTRALLDLDARFEPGAVTVVSGPNGSGKSTLLSLLAQTARPTSGHIRYDVRLHDDTSLRAAVGLVAHDALLYPDLTGVENLALYAALYSVRDASSRVEELRERFGVGRFGERPVRTYSRGQLQRVSLCRALLHAPRILLLDEPTNGLDADSIERLADAIAAERARSVVQVLVTHDRAFAERVGDTHIALRAGRRVSASEGAS